MEASFLTDRLQASLSQVSPSLPSQSSYLNHGLMFVAAADNSLSISSNNLDVAIRHTIKVVVEEEGVIALDNDDSRKFMAMVKTFPKSGVGVIRLDDDRIEVESGDTRARFDGCELGAFPVVPEVRTTDARFLVDGEQFSTALRKVAFSASFDNTRPVLGGVRVAIKGNEYTLATADGFRLTEYAGLRLMEGGGDISFILSNTAVKQIIRIAKEGELYCEIGRGDFTGSIIRLDYLHNDGSTTTITSHLIEGTFPDYRLLIPQKHNTMVEANGRRFREQVAALTQLIKTNHPLRLEMVDFGGERLMLAYCAAKDNATRFDSEVSLEKFRGRQNRVALNPLYVNDFLRVTEGNIILEMTAATAPIKIQSPMLPGWSHVLMPMFVQWDSPEVEPEGDEFLSDSLDSSPDHDEAYQDDEQRVHEGYGPEGEDEYADEDLDEGVLERIIDIGDEFGTDEFDDADLAVA